MFLAPLFFFVACALAGVAVILGGRAADRSAERAATAQAAEPVNDADPAMGLVAEFLVSLGLAACFFGCLVLGLGFGSAQ